MTSRLTLVSDRGAAPGPHRSSRGTASGRPAAPAPVANPATAGGAEQGRAPGPSFAPPRPRERRTLLQDERGAVTAEYAIIIMAAVAFAGLLVAIMRSSEIRAMLVQLVQNALGSSG